MPVKLSRNRVTKRQEPETRTKDQDFKRDPSRRKNRYHAFKTAVESPKYKKLLELIRLNL